MIVCVNIDPNGCEVADAHHVLKGCAGSLRLRAHSNDAEELNSISRVVSKRGIDAVYDPLPAEKAGNLGRLYRVPNQHLSKLLEQLNVGFWHDPKSTSGKVRYQFGSIAYGPSWRCRCKEADGTEYNWNGQWAVFAPDLDTASSPWCKFRFVNKES